MANDFEQRIHCPICGRRADCRRSLQTGAVHCHHADEFDTPPGWYFGGVDKLGFRMFFNDSNHRPSWRPGSRSSSSPSPAPKKTIDKGDQRFRETTRDKTPLTAAQRDAIASILCLPTGIIDLLEVEWLESNGSRPGCFVFPEKDANRRVIGYCLRFLDGTKRFHGKRGLTIPKDHPSISRRHTDAVLIPEGPTDVGAILSMGMFAVGRPSNVGGIDYLVPLLTLPTNSRV